MFNIRARKRVFGSLLAIAALAVVPAVAPSTAPAAQAAVPCPVNPGPVGIDGYVADFSGKGVTLCTGWDGEVVRVKVQIIDISAGARLKVSSNSATVMPNPADNTFGKRTVPDWATNKGGIQAPGTGLLFSVTNASFFTDTSSAQTPLSLPVKVNSTAQGRSYGKLLYGSGTGSAVAKKVLRYNSGGGVLQIASFPTGYNSTDAQCIGWDSCVVGYDPLIDLSGNGNTTNVRTYVGVNAVHGQNASRAFVLTGSNLRVADADLILQHFGAVSAMQLDGGGSTAMKSWGGDWLGPLGRPVPTILTVTYGN